MTPIQKIINLAIKNGYPAEFKLGQAFRIEPENEIGGRLICHSELLLDPEFHKAINKAKGFYLSRKWMWHNLNDLIAEHGFDGGVERWAKEVLR